MEKQEQGQSAPLLQALGPRHRNIFLVNRAGQDSKYIGPGGKLGVLPISGMGWLRVSATTLLCQCTGADKGAMYRHFWAVSVHLNFAIYRDSGSLCFPTGNIKMFSVALAS